MVKNDLIKGLTKAFPGISKKDMSAIVNTLFESITEGLTHGEAVELRGLGRLTVRKRQPIEARNPRTETHVHVPTRWVVHFKGAQSLTQRLNNVNQK